MASIVNGHVETVRLLLSVQGINVNMKDVNGFTALHMALFKAPQDMLIHELIKAGIDKNIPDNTGKSAVDYVREKDAFGYFPSLRDPKPK
jgi:ankyrin repeat protein